jgi:uncharacterized membrane protein YjjP (DUF1212 family)
MAQAALHSAVEQERELLDFVLQIGRAMNQAGTAVNETQDRLVRIAAAYGADAARIVVLPTMLIVSLGRAETATIERVPQVGALLRLDQISALFELVRRAERARVSLADGRARLTEILALPPRFGVAATVFGYVIFVVGICLILEPAARELGAAAVLGAVVAALGLLVRGHPRLTILFPVAAAALVSTAVFVAADHGVIEGTLRPLVAPLIGFLPGAALTTATVELASGEMVAGASRLVYGGLQLALLTFGVLAGSHLAGLPSSDALADQPANLLGWWAPWVGVLVFGAGAMLYFSAPRRSFAWLLVVLYAAWIGQVVGNELFGGFVSGFVGALVMIPAAYVIAGLPTGPPAMVTFLPAFWLLVPGSLGLIGVAEIASGGPTGVNTLVGALGSIVAIALGVLCGVVLYQNVSTAPGRLRRLRSG